jgi:hypothetical protein
MTPSKHSGNFNYLLLRSVLWPQSICGFHTHENKQLLTCGTVFVSTQKSTKQLHTMQTTLLIKGHDNFYYYVSLSALVSQQESAHPFQIIPWCSYSECEWNGRKNSEVFQSTKQYDGNSDTACFHQPGLCLPSYLQSTREHYASRKGNLGTHYLSECLLYPQWKRETGRWTITITDVCKKGARFCAGLWTLKDTLRAYGVNNNVLIAQIMQRNAVAMMTRIRSKMRELWKI